MSKDYAKAVNVQIANFNIMYVKLHNFHWFVKGPRFFSLHMKFEELYNEMSEHIDNLAERLLAVGEKPLATSKQYLEVATIEEASGSETAEDMVTALRNDLVTLSTGLSEARTMAEEAGDDATGDMLLEMVTSFEKHTWMLNAFLPN